MATEELDPRFVDLDLWPTGEAIAAMLEGQVMAVAAVAPAIGALARAADAAASRLGETGRLVYVGAGTSGRIAVQDGAELPPTFDWPAARLVYAIAGGERAITTSVERAEDDAPAGARAIDDAAIGASDVVIAVAASGTTPYTLAALRRARERGALTIAIANNRATPLLEAGEHALLLETGGEVIAGSTRMKAGTAQKVALNLLSSAIMIRLGGVHRGMMVNMRATNAKLEQRAERMVARIAGCDGEEARRALREAGGEIKLAVLITHGAGIDQARAALHRAGGHLRLALAEIEA